ncbi:NAD-dependent epimerase/dehydratase family protein [Aspergillus lucknowensis]|uniref:NAD-dependent epimerase/dehydratase domain-containing protein n=1 Tax=Aspergillus lucknowensis TaxID=176173 RepID=A0ABR4LLN2_9EURO
MPPKTGLVTGANGYVGNIVARAFSRAGWITYGFVRSASAAQSLELEEILPVLSQIDDIKSHQSILKQLPATLDAIVSTTESLDNYAIRHKSTVQLLRTVSLAKIRARSSLDVFQHLDAFAAVVVRPTNVFGRSASYHRGFFELPVVPNSIFHTVHVDDCGDACVAIENHPQREDIVGQVFNISARQYETVDQIARALLAEYDIRGGLRYVEPGSLLPSENPWPPALIDFPQWTGSDQIRKVTGCATLIHRTFTSVSTVI